MSGVLHKVVIAVVVPFAAIGLGWGAVPPGAGEPQTADALVRKLGDPEFAEREAAEQRLRALGAKALPAVRAGAASDDPEVARRCQALLGRIRRDVLDTFVTDYLADKDRIAEFDHPVWKRFVSLAGDDRASRDLFAEVIADPRRARLIDIAEVLPKERARVYREEAARLSFDARCELANRSPGGYRLLEVGPKRYEPKPKPELVMNASLAAYFVLGSYPETMVTVTGGDRAGLPVREALLLETTAFETTAGNAPSSLRPIMRRLFAAWLDRRVDPDALESAYWRATSGVIPEAVPAARRLLTANKVPSRAQAYAAVFLARCGDRTDLARIERLLDDSTVAREVIYDQKPAPVQVRDAALAACLLLSGANPADFGFDVLRLRRDPKGDAFEMAWLGFWSAESRDSAHKKAREWLQAEAKKSSGSQTRLPQRPVSQFHRPAESMHQTLPQRIVVR